MIPTPALGHWLQIGLALGLGSTAIVLVGILLQRWLTAAIWRRTWWRATLVGFGLLLVGEVTGLASGSRGLIWLLTVGPGAEPSRVAPVPPRRPLSPRAQALLEKLRERYPDLARKPDAGDGGETEVMSAEPPSWPAVPAWWPGILWASGSLLLLFRLAAAQVLLGLLARRSAPVTDPALQARLLDVARRLACTQPIRLLQAENLVSPAALGIVRPAILVPATFAAECSPRRQEAVLAHELAHLQSRDPAWLLLGDLVTACLWWLPGVWWARRQLDHAAEAVADEASLVVTDGPQELAACLVELGRRLAPAGAGRGIGMAGPTLRSALGLRVQRLLGLTGRSRSQRRQLRALGGRCAMAGVMLAIALGVTFWIPFSPLAEGDASMPSLIQAWRRSLAGVVVLATLGTGGEQTPAQEPVRPASGVRDESPTFVGKLDVSLVEQAGAAPGLGAPGGQAQPTAGGQAGGKAGTSPKGANKGNNPASGGGMMGSMAGRATPPAELRIKVFRLRHADPEVLNEVLQGLLPETTAIAAGGGPGGHVQMMAGMAGGLIGGGAPGGMMPGAVPGMGGVGALGMGGGALGLGGGGPGMGVGFANTWRASVDARTRSLIVRGSPRDLTVAADLVRVLDLPADQPIPKVATLRAFRLRHADPDALAEELNGLELNARIMAVHDAKLLIVAGSEELMNELGEVITQLDVEGTPPAKPPEKPQPMGKGAGRR